MQSALIIECFMCNVSVLCSALYAILPLFSVLLYEKCPYYVVLYNTTVTVVVYIVHA